MELRCFISKENNRRLGVMRVLDRCENDVFVARLIEREWTERGFAALDGEGGS